MKNSIKIIVGILTVFMFTSCYNTKRSSKVWIPKGQDLFLKTSGQPVVTDSIHLKGGAQATIKDQTGHLQVTFRTTPDSDTTKDIAGDNHANQFYAHFPKQGYAGSKSFKYIEQAPVFQAVSVPFKVRPRANDSIPYEVSTSANVGFAFGWEFTHKWYSNIYEGGSGLKSRTRQFSYAPSVFFGPTTVALKNGNTNNLIGKDRTILGLNAGAMMVFGVSRFDVGLAAGFDWGLGKPSKNWIYQGKPWFGLVVGFEFIK